jgi:hypothetical protein
MRKTAAESFRSGDMTIRLYRDKSADAARAVISDEPVAHTRRFEGLGNADFDAAGNLVALEIFNVTEQVRQWRERKEAEQPPLRPAEEMLEDLQAFASRSVERAKEIAKAN